MSVRDKGPLWVMYPFSDAPALKTETNYSRCIWQLNRLQACRRGLTGTFSSVP